MLPAGEVKGNAFEQGQGACVVNEQGEVCRFFGDILFRDGIDTAIAAVDITNVVDVCADAVESLQVGADKVPLRIITEQSFAPADPVSVRTGGNALPAPNGNSFPRRVFTAQQSRKNLRGFGVCDNLLRLQELSGEKARADAVSHAALTGERERICIFKGHEQENCIRVVYAAALGAVNETRHLRAGKGKIALIPDTRTAESDQVVQYVGERSCCDRFLGGSTA